MAGGDVCAEVGKKLPSKHKDLSSNPILPKKFF
jgi:hypothetical protein